MAEHDDGGNGDQQHQRSISDQYGAARAGEQATGYGDCAHWTNASAVLCGATPGGI